MSFFRIKNGIILRKRNCKFKQDIDILARSKTESFVLDNKLFEFLTHCNGVNSFNKIKSVYYRIFKKRLKTLKDIMSNSYLNEILENPFTKSYINKNQIIEVDKLECSCRNAIWHLTNLCNLNCSHCYYITNKRGDSQKRNFNRKEIKTIVNNLCQIGVERVVVTGGEPLLEKEKLKYLIGLLTEKCLFFTINTNALERVDLLLKIFKNNPYAESIQVSLDGDRNTHEKFRGRNNCYQVICKHIKQLSEAGIKVKIVSMITKDWIGREKDIFKIIQQLGAREWLIEIPTKVGKWQDNYLKYEVNKSQLINISKRFISLIKNENHYLEEFAINQIYNWPEHQSFINKKLSDPVCFHDLGLLSFGPEGISFCTLFGEKFGASLYKIAPAYTKDIKKIWNFIAKTRISHKIGGNQCCQNCNLFNYCQGGCPGQYDNPFKFKGCDRQSKFLASVKKDLFK
ncbi:MAG: radical SAM protein [bacterium]|nr:radical SAM protein [bacterium]